jgi:hypothetical protein
MHLQLAQILAHPRLEHLAGHDRIHEVEIDVETSPQQ